MMARKYLENRVLWITVEVLRIGVHRYKDLRATSGLCLVFLVLATMGLIPWWQGHRRPVPA
jgi:nicotinamide mononucleotide transporter